MKKERLRLNIRVDRAFCQLLAEYFEVAGGSFRANLSDFIVDGYEKKINDAISRLPEHREKLEAILNEINSNFEVYTCSEKELTEANACLLPKEVYEDLEKIQYGLWKKYGIMLKKGGIAKACIIKGMDFLKKDILADGTRDF